MKQKDFHIYLTEQERTQVVGALIELKNSLIDKADIPTQ